MPAVTIRRRSSTMPLVFAAVFLTVALLVGGLFVYLLFGGSITVPFTTRVLSFTPPVEEKKDEQPANTTAIPISMRTIAPYTQVSLEDLWDVKHSRIGRIYAPKDDTGSAILDANSVVGRVLAREKPSGRPFIEADFLPKGTRPGLVAGIPPGMRAMRIGLEQVRGLYGLNPGDRFDLVSTLAMQGHASDELARYGGVHAGQLALEATLGNMDKQATVNVIVQNGVVVEGVATIQVPIATGGSHGGQGVRTRPVQEVVIAVAPEAVARLTEALAVEAQLSVIPRSGHPDDPQDSITPSSHPWTPFGGGDQADDGSGKTRAAMQFVEQVNGSKRELVPVPTQGEKK